MNEQKENPKIIIDRTLYKGENNDNIIAASAIKYAKESLINKVYMLSDDIIFKYLTDDYKNIEALTPNEYEIKFPVKKDFDEFATQDFIEAVRTKNVNGVKKIIDLNLKNIDVNKADINTGYTPLIIAIRNRDYQMIETLLSIHCLDINACDKSNYSFTALLHACQIKDLRVFKLLIEAGADVNGFGKGKNFGNTPLMVCAWGYFNEGLEYIMQFDVSYNQQDDNGYTALHKTCIKNNVRAAELLIDKVDSRIVDHKGKHAYDYLNVSIPQAKNIMRMFVERKLVK